jgi:hypothetical protein
MTDTSPQAQAIQFQILRAMPGEQRLLMAFEMSMFARELASERIRQEHPAWNDTQICARTHQAGVLSGVHASVALNKQSLLLQPNF